MNPVECYIINNKQIRLLLNPRVKHGGFLFMGMNKNRKVATFLNFRQSNDKTIVDGLIRGYHTVRMKIAARDESACCLKRNYQGQSQLRLSPQRKIKMARD